MGNTYAIFDPLVYRTWTNRNQQRKLKWCVLKSGVYSLFKDKEKVAIIHVGETLCLQEKVHPL